MIGNVLEILHSFLIHPFKRGTSSYVTGVLSWVLCLIMVGLLIVVMGFIFNGIDKFTGNRLVGTGVLLDKSHIPSHTELVLTYNSATKMSIPQPVHVDSDWRFVIKLSTLPDYVDTLSVSESEYHKYSIGSELDIEYSIGRIFDQMYIHGIQ